jgi:hypothetical protein
MLRGSDIVEERYVGDQNLRVSAPGGRFVRVTHVCRTIPLPLWEVTLDDNRRLQAADMHLLQLAAGWFLPVSDLRAGDVLQTDAGPARIRSCLFTGRMRTMYDLRVASEDHCYYTNGFLSHNSTGLGLGSLFRLHAVRAHKELYVAPLKEHIKTFGDNLLNMQRGSAYGPDYFARKRLRNNLYYKESASGGFLKLMNVLTDPTKVRGNSCQTVTIDEAQHFDPEHVAEIFMVQKAYVGRRRNLNTGTATDLDSFVHHEYLSGSQGVWHIPCGCRAGWHALNDATIVEAMLAPDGLRCPADKHRKLYPERGEYVHAVPARARAGALSFHAPQVIVPEYAHGVGFLDIWRDFNKFPLKKFLREVWGIPVEAGHSEITEKHLRDCCSDKTFAQIQKDLLSGKTRYARIYSGVDWGGSDHEPAHRSKLSYTVHAIYGHRLDGKSELIHACRYANAHYMDIANDIITHHLNYKAFAMGTDQGGGQYYNAHMRDSGKIPTNLLINFQYTDTHAFIDRIKHPYAHIISLHRTDSISALFEDIKAQNIIFPRWDECAGFVTDFLNVRRNFTETSGGRTIMRFLKKASRADDFVMATNYAIMMKRIAERENTIPNAQLMRELAGMFGVIPMPVGRSGLVGQNWGGYVGG